MNGSKINPIMASNVTDHGFERAIYRSNLTHLEEVRSFVQRLCEDTSASLEAVILLQLAINEIFCNSVEHSYHNRTDGRIVIDGSREKEGLSFVIADQGDSFRPLMAKAPDLTAESVKGFGLYIIQKSVDEVHYSPKTESDG